MLNMVVLGLYVEVYAERIAPAAIGVNMYVEHTMDMECT